MALAKSPPLMASNPDHDSAWVIRLARGDEAALTCLYERHAQAVLGYLVQLTGDRGEAEELLQDTFVAAWRAAGGFNRRSTVLTWLLGIARRRARDGRRRRRLPTVDKELFELAVAGFEELALARLELGQLGRLVAQLPAAHREVLSLALVQELSYAEVAEVLGISVGTVKSRLHAARRALQTRAVTVAGDEEVLS